MTSGYRYFGAESVEGKEVAGCLLADSGLPLSSVRLVFQGSADSIVYSNQWSRERRDVLIEKAAVGVAAAFAAVGQSAPGAGERLATHPASAVPAANGGKAAK